jgi:hypothetical protein
MEHSHSALTDYEEGRKARAAGLTHLSRKSVAWRLGWWDEHDNQARGLRRFEQFWQPRDARAITRETDAETDIVCDMIAVAMEAAA